MITIAICDDEKLVCANLEKNLIEISNNGLIDIETEIFNSGIDLIDYIKKGGYFDIIFLDILMDEVNGIEVGRIIRDDMENESTQIIYISRRKDHVMEMFDIRAFNFIIKPIDIKRLEQVFKKAVKLIEKNNQSFKFTIGKTIISKPIKDILYFESTNRKISVVTKVSSESFYGKMDDVLKKTHGHDFLYIHKSYLINYIHTIIITYTQIKMTNGIVLPISQNRRKQIRELLLKMGKRENK